MCNFNFFQDWTYIPSEEYGLAEGISLGFDNTAFPFLVLVGSLAGAVLLALAEKVLTWIRSCFAPKKKTL